MTVSLENDFCEKNAWLIGATGTLGQTLAKTLVDRGANVILSGRDNDKLSHLSKSLGCRTFPVALDVKKEQSVRDAAHTIEEKFGTVDLLIVSIAVPEFGDFLELDDQSFTNAMDTKYMGSLRAIRSVLPGMIQNKFGRIVVLSGGSGTIPRPVHLPGGGANAALELVARGLAKRYANDGVRINIVAPGPIASPRMEQIVAATAVAGEDESDRPIGQPIDVAEAVCYLLSGRSEFINGTVLKVDGGVK
ncbi:SDR family NAD(P)-dependent oxidoreductase [Advenella kashmirensis]